MMTVQNKYIVTTLDLHAIDLEDFQYTRANITGLKIVNTDDEAYVELLNETNYRLRKLKLKPASSISTASAMLYDAVVLFARALEDLDNGKNVDEFPAVFCDYNTKGTDGTSLINYMKSNKIEGLTGLVHFDGQGFRSPSTLDIVQLTKIGLKKIGDLLPRSYINICCSASKVLPVRLRNRKLIITTILNKPFVMLRNSGKMLSGNDRYEGFSIDLISALAQILSFSYEIREVADNKHGVEVDKKRGIWNGMIGEVLEGVADMAVADVTITETRQKVVDFTLPFMYTGISILFKKPTEKEKSLFSFMAPFSEKVWIYLLAAYLGVSFVLFIVGRLSPYEWGNIHPCRQDDRIEENSFTLLNTMWFTFATVMQQGCEVEPRSPSTRAIACTWYFFTLIMISSYTANLAAFLTIEKTIYQIDSVEALASQTKIKYGCLRSGATRTFFETSTIPIYQHMWEYMQANPEVLMDSNEQGKERVYAGNYAYLMESASIQFFTQRECTLTQVGGLLDRKSYGIATKKDNGTMSGWLSTGILYLEGHGLIQVFQERWWKLKRGGGRCTEDRSTNVKELDLSSVGGVFVVLLGGIILASTIVLLEILWNFRNYSVSKGDFNRMMAKDIKFALTCSSNVKEIPRPQKRLKTSQSAVFPLVKTEME